MRNCKNIKVALIIVRSKMTEKKSEKTVLSEKDERILWKYIETVTENNRLCGQLSNRFLYFFLAVSVICYFLCSAKTTTVDIYGLSIDIPQKHLLIVLPLFLSYIYYCFMSFASLSDTYSCELKAAWKKLGKEYQTNFTKSHLNLLRPLHILSWGEIKESVGEKSPFFNIFDKFSRAIHLISIIIILPLVILYFIKKGWSGDLLLVVPYSICFFFIIYSIYEFFNPIEIPNIFSNHD